MAVFLDSEAQKSFLRIGHDQAQRAEIVTLQQLVGSMNQQRIRAERRVKELTEDRNEVLDEAFARIDVLEQGLARKDVMLEKACDAVEIWQRECEIARKKVEEMKEENIKLLQRLGE